MAYVKEGLEQYELAAENTRLFALAKQQNTKLFEMNSTLNESAKKRADILKDLDAKIVAKSNLIARTKDGIEAQRDRIKKLMLENGLLDHEKMNRFYWILLDQLVLDFQNTDGGKNAQR
ncbi:MAG: hypothetical protein HQK61_08090 [Desulfamplus sp.]|nr:hypothetical protein [Desulfamplus sp.]